MPLSCGRCQKQYKSYLRLQAHMSDVHGQKNAASKWTKEYNQKERLAMAEENLKKEISKYQYYNN